MAGAFVVHGAVTDEIRRLLRHRPGVIVKAVGRDGEPGLNAVNDDVFGTGQTLPETYSVTTFARGLDIRRAARDGGDKSRCELRMPPLKLIRSAKERVRLVGLENHLQFDGYIDTAQYGDVVTETVSNAAEAPGQTGPEVNRGKTDCSVASNE